MRAGTLRHTLTFQDYTEALNALGETVQTWTTVKTIRGRVSPMRAGEGYEAQQNVARVSHEIAIRANALAVTHEMRILFDSRYFYIQGIRNDDERGIMLTLECNEKAA